MTDPNTGESRIPGHPDFRCGAMTIPNTVGLRIPGREDVSCRAMEDQNHPGEICDLPWVAL